MKFIGDLHIHSRFSRATSRDLDPEHLSLWAQKKGIRIIGTGDFTHPGWISELEDKLMEAEEGLYRLKPEIQKAVDREVPPFCRGPSRFLLSGEISCIYKKGERTRKVHHLILMPDLAAVTLLNRKLARIGNIHSDGRPILGLDSRNLLEMVLESSDKSFFIPAHVWTPWFSLFGSKSGFDALEECFQDLSGHIHALETGLSSDPPMNRRLSSLDKYLLVSNSDAHSPGKLGREANLFDTEPDYPHMIQSMKDGRGFSGTVEFFPEEGKYHLDGHRKCGTRLDPPETRRLEGSCPECGRPVTVGVLHRVEELSDRLEPEPSKDFFSLIPLPEIVAEILGCGSSTKKVLSFYESLLWELGPELHILMERPIREIAAAGGPLLGEAIERMRGNRVIRDSGYDGEYGRIRLFTEAERHAAMGQGTLFTAAGRHSVPADSPPLSSPPLPPRIRKTEIHPGDCSALSDPILDPLNPKQDSAVRHPGGHLLILAGPGTGKTLTLTHRIACLIRSGRAAPRQILALTFTRKAAGEMAERIRTLVGEDSAQVRVSTFHRFCLDLLGSEGNGSVPDRFTLCSEADQRVLARAVLAGSGKGKRSLVNFLNTVQRIRTAWVLEGSPNDSDLSDPLYEEYQLRLRSLGMLDLDELEIEALKLFRGSPEICRVYAERFPWIFVDEYQDTGPVQIAILSALVQTGVTELCAIGDPDQAIYGFRGARGSCRRFAEEFPNARSITLTENYRSGESILLGAAALMKKGAPLTCNGGTRGTISVLSCTSERQEAEMVVEQIEKRMGGISTFSIDSGRVDSTRPEERSVGFGDIGVLYRLNAQGDLLEEALKRRGIPCARSGDVPLSGRYPVDLLLRFLQVCRSPENPLYLEAYEELLRKYKITEEERPHSFAPGSTLIETLDRACAWHRLDRTTEEVAGMLDSLEWLARECNGDLGDFLDRLSLERGIDHGTLTGDRVALMSLHASKGLEWPIVFITGCEEKLLPCSLFGKSDEAEERRLFYVGLTRARDRLILSHSKRRFLHGRLLQMNPSPFLEAISKDLLTPLDRGEQRRRKNNRKQLNLFS
jgi:DNA helicase II / ATP-dependent DNA helicase PcrA